MIAKKLKTPIAVLVVVALAASTALQFHSWWEVASGEDWESFESARRALAARPNRNSRTAYERAYNNLVQRGLDPHSRRFNRVLRKKVEAKQRVLHQSREYHLKRKENQRSLREDHGKVRGEKTTTTDVMQNLRENMEIWLRGDFLLRRGEYVSNARGRSEEVEEAKTMAELNVSLTSWMPFKSFILLLRFSFEDFKSTQLSHPIVRYHLDRSCKSWTRTSSPSLSATVPRTLGPSKTSDCCNGMRSVRR